MTVWHPHRLCIIGALLGGVCSAAPSTLVAQAGSTRADDVRLRRAPPADSQRGALPADSQHAAPLADSRHVAAHGPLFTTGDAVAAGAFVVGTAALLPFDEHIAHWFQRPALQRSHVAGNVATGARVLGLPGTLVIAPALYVVGRVGHHEHAADLGVHASEAIAIALGTTFLVKSVAGRARPYVVHESNAHDFRLGRGVSGGTDYASFPSGHAAAAFAMAAATTAETSRWWPGSARYMAPLLYGGATVVALSRLYDDKHWASDVMMGAGIGTLSGWTVVRYTHQHPHNWIDQWLLAAAVVPVPTGGVMVVWSFPAP